ncbi:amidohydrolase [Mycoplasma seminis]|uniref:5-methylthioadenosine/S-adenosylhomocysteine deaminase n=1 Tax=Mycoplasma seminis TaxID=512749 RepID=A0ABY9H9R8_9MOLU|nr:amidohydrolase [Mycoplasma seminis]WLP85325.1 amidohydrolase [Mycoplasma seminis]
MNIWIKNATVVTMDDDNKMIKNANVYISGKKIQYVGTDTLAKFAAEKVIDAKNNVLMPGMINTHCHIPMTILRNHANDVNLEDWLYNCIFPVEAKMSSQDIYYGALLGMAEMISTGTTSFVDMYFYVDQIAKAAEKMKIRAYLGIGITQDSVERNINDTKALHQKYLNNELINIMVAPHAVYTNSEETLYQTGNALKELNTIHTIHLNESKAEVKNSFDKYHTTPVFEAYKTGNLTSNTIIGHGVNLNESEIELIKQVGASIAHNPCSNLKLSSGVLPVQKLLNRGINICLGTDGAASNNNLDMFEEMKIASLLQKGVFGAPTLLNAWDTLKLATVNGAKALHRENELGKIKQGYIADLILVDLNNINHTPRANIIDSLVYSTNSHDVYTTIINGEIVYEDRKFTNINLQELMDKVNELYANLTK